MSDQTRSASSCYCDDMAVEMTSAGPVTQRAGGRFLLPRLRVAATLGSRLPGERRQQIAKCDSAVTGLTTTSTPPSD